MNFQEKIKAGKKVITAEITPPHGSNVSEFCQTAKMLKPYFDALNVTDNQRALMRMSNLATASILVQEGVEPIYQLTCRDRNSLGLQADLLGAEALGVPNVLCLTGDPVRAGHFEAKGVFEVESVGLLNLLKDLKVGKDSAGKSLSQPSKLFAGAVVNPSAKALAPQIRRMGKKIQAGAEFFQTQAIFSASMMENFLKESKEFSVPIIAGILVVRSLKTAQFLQNKVPGVFVPDELFKALESAEDPEQAGVDFAMKLAQDLLGMVQGVHLMAVKGDEFLIDIVRNGNLRGESVEKKSVNSAHAVEEAHV